MATIMEKTLAQYEEDMKAAAVAVVEVLNNPEADDATLKKAKDNLKGAVAAYNTKAAEDAYTGWAKDYGEHAVREAIRTLYIPKSRKVSTKRNKTSGKYEYKISDAEIRINLKAMMDTIGAEGYFPNEKWFGAMQRLCFIMAGNINKELKLKNADFKSFLQAAGQAFNFAPDADFTSNTSCKKALQQTVDMIIFEKKSEKADSNKYEINSQDLVYIDRLLCEEGKPDEILMRNTFRVVDLVVNVLYRKVTGEELKFVAG